MRRLIVILCVLSLVGCDSEVDQRRRHTLNHLGIDVSTPENQRVQRLIVAAIERADDESLQSPNLVNVTMRVVPDNADRGTLGVDWIAAQPGADGIRVRFSDGSQSDMAFDDVELDYAEHASETSVLFSGNPFVGREYPAVWKKLLADRGAKALLLNGRDVVSNESPIHVIELGG